MAKPKARNLGGDFVHKMKVALKELRETLVWLKIIVRKPLCPPERLIPISQENDELISIFVTSVKTAQRNREGKGTSE